MKAGSKLSAYAGAIAVCILPVTASSQRAAEWVIPGGASSAASAPVAPAPAAPVPVSPPSTQSPDFIDTSEYVLLADRALADRIFDEGPLAGYLEVISPAGVLFDANGGAPEGQGGITQRFATFPDGVKLDRRPIAALGSGSSGSSWGTYAVRRGDQVMTEGHYLTSWRREDGQWRIVTELAAGRANTPAAAAAGPVPRAPGGPRPSPSRLVRPGAAPVSAPSGPVETPPMRDALGRPVATTPAAPELTPSNPAPPEALRLRP
jgi:hypothetical protein